MAAVEESLALRNAGGSVVLYVTEQSILFSLLRKRPFDYGEQG